jgi:hypothetical protein
MADTCKTCAHFSDFSESDPEEPVGYCTHPKHWEPTSEHAEYGGHWAASDYWCDGFTPIIEAAELAFEDILHALDEDMGCSLSETPVQLCCYWTGRADAPCGECERLKAAIVKAICGVRP